MRYSKLFGKSNKSSREFDSINATLLIKGGFIDQTMAGVYTFLPLGLRVLNKIENIIREEMDKIGNELFMPAISPKEYWETTNRLEGISVLLKASAANDLSKKSNATEYVLNSTHEEVVTPIAKKFNFSYRDLPFAVYQVQTKFRNEARPKSGLLRCREFRMKDLYSFHKDESCLKSYYENSKEAYMNVYRRVGLGDITEITLASGGDFTKDFSHEFQTRCTTGEDIVFKDPKTGICYNKEIAPAKTPTPENKPSELLPMEDVYGENIVGVDDLCKFLKITPDQTTKTLIYQTDDRRVIAASLRGDYEINELKLKKIVGCKELTLADPATVEKTTGAKIGYAGVVNLPKDVELYMDDSAEHLVNFETGSNKTNYHAKNVNFGRDLPMPEKFYDFKIAKDGDLNPETNHAYEVFPACEVGNIFPLNTKFSKAFDYTYKDDNGIERIVYMGSYGIGPSRMMGVLVEVFNDGNGIVWPANVAPYQVQLISLGKGEDESLKKGEQIYEELTKAGIEVLYDDREVSPGIKFSDADLIGNPIRVLVSKKSLEKDSVEVKLRKDKDSQLVNLSELKAWIKNALAE